MWRVNSWFYQYGSNRCFELQKDEQCSTPYSCIIAHAAAAQRLVISLLARSGWTGSSSEIPCEQPHSRGSRVGAAQVRLAGELLEMNSFARW